MISPDETLADTGFASVHARKSAANPGRTQRTSFYRFGNESQMHFGVPMPEVGSRDVYVLFQRPKELTETDRGEFESILHEVRAALATAVRCTFEKQNAHMAPQLRVVLPGTYLTSTASGHLIERRRDLLSATFSQANHSHTLETSNANADPAVIRSVVSDLLQNVLRSVDNI